MFYLVHIRRAYALGYACATPFGGWGWVDFSLEAQREYSARVRLPIPTTRIHLQTEKPDVPQWYNRQARKFWGAGAKSLTGVWGIGAQYPSSLSLIRGAGAPPLTGVWGIPPVPQITNEKVF